MHDTDRETFRQRRRRIVRWGMASVVLATLLGGAAGALLALEDKPRAWWAGETDLQGNRLYTPPHPVHRDQIASIDLEQVHADLLPAWVIAGSQGPPGRDREAQRFDALRQAIDADPNLAELLDGMRAANADAMGNTGRIFWLSWAWNRYLDDAGEPWRISSTIQTTEDGSYFYTKSYRVLADTRTSVGSSTHRTRLMTRVDHTNVVELYLGTASNHHEGALVVVDRVRDHVLRKIWPLLDARVESRLTDVQRAFAGPIRKNLAKDLAPDHMRALTQTAASRGTLLQLIDQVHRRHDCGSRFLIQVEPWNGLNDEHLAALTRFASSDRGRPCPSVTDTEVVGLRLLSQELRGAEDELHLEAAVQALVAWSTRGVAVHEARHAADADEPLVCSGCPAEFRRRATHEMSAYLAAFADAQVSVPALYQACMLELEQAGPSGLAIAFLLGELLPRGCRAGPPADLTDRARALELALLGRSDAVTLSVAYPSALPLGD